jgi:hypothetical protein
VLDQHHPFQRAGQELDHLVHAVARTGGDVIDDGVRGVDGPVGVPVALIDRMAVADQHLLDLQPVGHLLCGHGHAGSFRPGDHDGLVSRRGSAAGDA